ncbi:Hypothetical predicted protein [Podarcis lilfordi]|uniref:Uncharacterized protein n=1 Tax=Podarcis lilfordi TaxID=74358 RepID=A0AA35NZ93_9SAUR|nr:Hypothetical predicted protein [Podarcis lilfordi]
MVRSESLQDRGRLWRSSGASALGRERHAARRGRKRGAPWRAARLSRLVRLCPAPSGADGRAGATAAGLPSERCKPTSLAGAGHDLDCRTGTHSTAKETAALCRFRLHVV